ERRMRGGKMRGSRAAYLNRKDLSERATASQRGGFARVGGGQSGEGRRLRENGSGGRNERLGKEVRGERKQGREKRGKARKKSRDHTEGESERDRERDRD